MSSRVIPAGILGSYYASRHSYGHYRSCAVTGTYHLPAQSQNRLVELLKFALQKCVERHPALCYGVAEKSEKSDAQFIQLATINWDDVVEIRTVNNPEHDLSLSKELGIGHQHLFKDPYHKPAWKVLVLRYDQNISNDLIRIDVAFLTHHAIADGSSATAFHKTLLEAFYQSATGTSLTYSWPYTVPITIPRPNYLEKALPFLQREHTGSTQATIAEPKPDFDPWTADPPFLSSIDEFVSRVHIITVPPHQLTNVLAYCRRLSITVTALLHGLIVLHLANAVESAQGFRAATPYSMRRFTQISDDEIVNHIDYVVHDWDSNLVTAMREASKEITEDRSLNKKAEKVILVLARQFQAEIAQELALVPERGSNGFLAVSKIVDYDRFCEEGMKKKRFCTYEVSNIGVVSLPERPLESSAVSLERFVFSQCGMVIGPAIGSSVVTVKGGPMALSLHWQEGALEEAFVGRLRDYLKDKLLDLGEVDR